MAPPKRKARRSPRSSPRSTFSHRPPTSSRRFVGRDPSPVLDHYPKKPSAQIPPPPPPRLASAAAPSPETRSTAPTAPGTPLLSLERPFDIDEFSQLLGETAIRVTVPREDLAEVLRRVSEFMGFGVYVYSISVRPANTELLKGFVVELHRVDFAREEGRWVPFVERGTSDSPFGPSSSGDSGSSYPSGSR
jgi:hypothetical protein